MSNLLPPNATSTEHAIDDSIARIGDVPVLARDMWNHETIRADLLPWLAWAYSVDDWDVNWSETQKRQAIASSISVHRYKGTIGAVKEAVSALGVDANIIEWFNMLPLGDPYTFSLELDVSDTPLDESTLSKLIDVVEATKNLRSHLIEVVPGATSTTNLYCAAVTGIGLEITIDYGGGNLFADGTVFADGEQRANGIKLL